MIKQVAASIFMFLALAPYAKADDENDMYAFCFQRLNNEFASWEEFFELWRSRRCPEASAVLAEGWADQTTLLLTAKWKLLPQLSELAPASSDERAFVLRYIDVTSPGDRLEKLDSLAKEDCPTGLSELCSQIRQRVAAAE